MWNALWIALTAFVVQIIPKLVTQVIAALGLTVITYPIFTYLIEQVRTTVFGYLSGLPLGVLQMMGLMGFDRAFRVIFSAYVFRAALAQLTNRRFRL
jgi:hypothetical protein